MDPAIVTARLSIVQEGTHVLADLLYTNVGDQPAFLFVANAGLDGTLENNVFKIKDEAETELSYVGPLSKRKPGPEDFRRLLPNEQVSTRVRLDTAYKFPSGAHGYRIVYSALHQYPDRPGFWRLVSNEARFLR